MARADGVTVSARRGRPSAGDLAVAVVLVAVAVPVAAVALRAVRPDGQFSLEAVERILGSPRTWRLIAVTVAQAAGSAAVTVVIGVPVAWVLSRFAFRGRSALRTLAMVPFVLPSVVIGVAFASLLGPQGLVDARGTWWPVIAAHLCFNLAVVVRTVGASVAAVDPDLEAAARILGAGPLTAARRVVLPEIRSAVTASAVVVFLFCLTSFGVIVILGGGRVSTVEVEIWTRATRQFDLSGAGVLGVVQLLAVIATLAIHGRLTRSGQRMRRHRTVGRRRPVALGERLAVAAAVGAVLVISGTPLLALVERSLRVGDRRSFANWRGLGSGAAGLGLRVSPWDAVLVSLSTALVATVLAMALALPAARVVARRPGGLKDRVLLLPLGVSATTVGLGLLLAVGRPPIDLRGSWWIVPVAQAMVALPLAVRAVVPALRSVPGSLLDGAALLGSSPAQRWWRVELPLVRRSIGAGAGLALVACLGEFGATVFLARTTRPTVPVAIERLMSRPGASGVGQAMALSCILLVICAVVMAAIDRWVSGDDGVDLGF